MTWKCFLFHLIIDCVYSISEATSYLSRNRLRLPCGFRWNRTIYVDSKRNKELQRPSTLLTDLSELVSLIRRLRLFERRVLRRIFGPKRDEVKVEWRKLHSEETDDLYCSHNIFRVIKSRRMRWAGHLAHLGRGETYTGFWRGNLRQRDHLVDLGVDGRLI